MKTMKKQTNIRVLDSQSMCLLLGKGIVDRSFLSNIIHLNESDQDFIPGTLL